MTHNCSASLFINAQERKHYFFHMRRRDFEKKIPLCPSDPLLCGSALPEAMTTGKDQETRRTETSVPRYLGSLDSVYAHMD